MNEPTYYQLITQGVHSVYAGYPMRSTLAAAVDKGLRPYVRYSDPAYKDEPLPDGLYPSSGHGTLFVVEVKDQKVVRVLPSTPEIYVSRVKYKYAYLEGDKVFYREIGYDRVSELQPLAAPSYAEFDEATGKWITKTVSTSTTPDEAT